VVHLHFFVGLPIEEVAETLGISRATAYRQWSYAGAWLRNAMGEENLLLSSREISRNDPID